MLEHEIVNLLDYLGMNHDEALRVMQHTNHTDHSGDFKINGTTHESYLNVRIAKTGIQPNRYRITVS